MEENKEKEEKIETKAKNLQSKAKRIKILLKQHKALWGRHQDLADFEEPVLFLMRNNRKVEFHDKATQGKFVYEHTDGKERAIELSPQFLHTFDYGKREFKGYVCHEDYPTPLPEIPIVTGEMYQMGIEKTLNDMKKWKSEEARALGQMWWKILTGVAVLIAVVFLGKLLFPNMTIPFLEKAPVVKQVTQTVVENTSVIAENLTKAIMP